MYSLRKAILNTTRTSRTFSFIPALSRPSPLLFRTQRAFSAAAGLSKSDIQQRILATLESFEKVPVEKVRHAFKYGHCTNNIMQLAASASFSKDLGLDSLDSVEVVMAIEEASLYELSIFFVITVKFRSLVSKSLTRRPTRSRAYNKVRGCPHYISSSFLWKHL
jgi:NADH dehydrogenase (ubiquinone) 1 alpha/beta subcomplex 1